MNKIYKLVLTSIFFSDKSSLYIEFFLRRTLWGDKKSDSLSISQICWFMMRTN